MLSSSGVGNDASSEERATADLFLFLGGGGGRREEEDSVGLKGGKGLAELIGASEGGKVFLRSL